MPDETETQPKQLLTIQQHWGEDAAKYARLRELLKDDEFAENLAVEAAGEFNKYNHSALDGSRIVVAAYRAALLKKAGERGDAPKDTNQAVPCEHYPCTTLATVFCPHCNADQRYSSAKAVCYHCGKEVEGRE